MSIFNNALVNALLSGEYYCRKCGARMEFEDESRDILICPNCGAEDDLDHYGFTDEEYEKAYPLLDDLKDEYYADGPMESNETYEEVCGELSED